MIKAAQQNPIKTCSCNTAGVCTCNTLPTYPYPSLPQHITYGWKCPTCGTVNAPWKERCDCNLPKYPTWTTQITTGGVYNTTTGNVI